jgi:hypothetical protein
MMAETKPVATTDKPVRDARELRTIEQTISEPLPPPTPTQEELDAIMLGEPLEPEPPPPEGETQEQRHRREEDKRKQREAKAAADKQAGYQTR